jgi:hypothetical protein
MIAFVDIQLDLTGVGSKGVPSKSSTLNQIHQLTPRSKPDSVDKLLARIEESGAREEIITALLGTSLPSPNTTVSLRGTPGTLDQPTDSTLNQSHANVSSHLLPLREPTSRDDSEDSDTLVSPLNIVTAAIASNTSARCDRLRSQIPLQPGAREAIMAPIKERLAAYFCR